MFIYFKTILNYQVFLSNLSNKYKHMCFVCAKKGNTKRFRSTSKGTRQIVK